MKRIVATIIAALTILFAAQGVASATVLTEAEQSQLSAHSSSSLFGPWQTTTRDLNTGLSIALCSDGSMDIAGLASEPGVYGVSLNIFGDIHPVMTARPFQTGEMVNVKSYTNLPALPGLPTTLAASKAPIGQYDDSVRAKFSQTVFMTVPAHGCHFQKVSF